MLGSDIRLFENTAVWSLAKAVDDENIKKIEALINAGADVDAREPEYGQSLLMMAILRHRYLSAAALLERGANPNAIDSYHHDSVLEIAIQNTQDDRFIKLLLQHGANPNLSSGGVYQGKKISDGDLPLRSANQNLVQVKALVEAGADINARSLTRSACNALDHASLDVMRYLIIEKGADFRTTNCIYTPKPGELPTYRIVDIIRQNNTAADLYRNDPSRSPQDREIMQWRYQTGMEIADFLKKNGEDY